MWPCYFSSDDRIATQNIALLFEEAIVSWEKITLFFYFWLMLTEDCTCYSKNEVIAFITNSCLNLQNYNSITCEQLVVTAVTSNAHTSLDS